MGVGIDEKSLLTILGKWDTNQLKSFRLATPNFFVEDEKLFEKLIEDQLNKQKREFSRFAKALTLWTIHPWERDARLINEALINDTKSYNVIIEITCTRSSEELLGARKAYHSLFKHSIEEDVAYYITTDECKLFVALVSAYRYEGPKVDQELMKSEAKTVYKALKNVDGKNPIVDDELVMILSMRSKLHIMSLIEYYQEKSGNPIDEVLQASMGKEADENAREGLTRVIITRTHIDMKTIKEEYHKKYGNTLSERIKIVANGNYKDFLLTLITREEAT
ncbi:hypothetical protein L1887_17701 [Cichorium endivia]|nr:hypothetical protein L1887_17701 [Cichorium endivia]